MGKPIDDRVTDACCGCFRLPLVTSDAEASGDDAVMKLAPFKRLTRAIATPLNNNCCHHGRLHAPWKRMGDRNNLVDIHIDTENNEPAPSGELQKVFVRFAPLLNAADFVTTANKHCDDTE